MDEGSGVASALDAVDDLHRSTVQRIGGALDVLSRDASLVKTRLDEARARQRVAELEAAFRADLLAQGTPTPTDSDDPFSATTTPDVLAEMDRVARVARARAEALKQDVRMLEEEGDDLAFQMQVLRGRMGVVQSDLRATRAAQDPRVDDVAQRIALAQDALAAAADALAQAVDGGRRAG
jgi:hypothetical protein